MGFLDGNNAANHPRHEGEAVALLERCHSALQEIARRLGTGHTTTLLDFVAQKACEVFGATACVIWKIDEKRQNLTVTAGSAGVDPEFRKLVLTPAPDYLAHLRDLETGYLGDVRNNSNKYYLHPEYASHQGWTSLLTAPMLAQGELRGMLDIYSPEHRRYLPAEKNLFGIFAHEVSVLVQLSEERPKLERLLETLDEMTRAQSEPDLLDLVLDRALDLTGAERGAVSRLDLKTGQLSLTRQRDSATGTLAAIGESGLNLKERAPVRVDDMAKREGSYQPLWAESISALAVPLLVEKAPIRAKSLTQYAAKAFGALNLESTRFAAFTLFHEHCISTLATHTASILERLERDRQLAKVSQAESEIAALNDTNSILEKFLDAVTETWGFEFANLSFVDDAENRIRTDRVRGIETTKIGRFRQIANHALSSNDIQADIVRTRLTEVPDQQDSRFDPEILKEFGYLDLVRVFIPMILGSDKRVVGTIEAGYRRTEHRQHIFEQDVESLKGLTEYVTLMLEHTKRRLLDQIGHELNAPLAGIRSNASFLRRRYNELAASKIELKLDDIITDSELLAYQVLKLEFAMGRDAPMSKIEETNVYRQVIVKTVHELRRVVHRDFELDSHRIWIDAMSFRSMKPLYLDRAKLSQAVFNVVINAIKYAGSNKANFNLNISLDNELTRYKLRFVDHGIGVEHRYESRIFEQGVRTPAAVKVANGTGLGLAISRQVLREMRGDLVLANPRNPTEFQIILPKLLEDDPDAGLH